MRTHKIALDEPSNNEGIIESHISSFIVFCQAEKQAAVAHSLRAQADIELHGSDEKGKFIVVTEAKNQGIILDRIERISAIAGVINTSMVYHQVSALDELDDTLDAFQDASLITTELA